MNILQDILGLITKRKIKTPSDNDYIVSAAYTDTQERLKPQPKMEANLLNIGALKKYILSSITPPTPPAYKVYTALLTQTGETAPVATVLENTLGFTPSFSYSSVGLYIINSPENYPMGKTACFISPSNSNFNGNVYLTQFSQSVFYINSLDTDNLDKDDMLANTTIEIRVYN